MKVDFQQLPSQATPLPYSVTSLSDLPQSLRQPALQSVELTDELISICVFPSRTWLKNWYGWEYVAEQALLFTSNGILNIQAPNSPRQIARVIYLRAAELLYTRLSLQLMYGRLELVDNSLSQVVVEFNAAGFDILQHGLQDLLGSSCGEKSIYTQGTPRTKRS